MKNELAGVDARHIVENLGLNLMIVCLTGRTVDLAPGTSNSCASFQLCHWVQPRLWNALRMPAPHL